MTFRRLEQNVASRTRQVFCLHGDIGALRLAGCEGRDSFRRETVVSGAWPVWLKWVFLLWTRGITLVVEWGRAGLGDL